MCVYAHLFPFHPLHQADHIAWALPAFPLTTLHPSQVLGATLPTLLARSALCESLSAARRVLSSGGVSVNNQRVSDANRKIESTDLLDGRFILLQVGKREKRLLDVRG